MALLALNDNESNRECARWCGEAVWTIDLRPWTIDWGLGTADGLQKSEKGVLQKATKTAKAET